MKSKKLSVLVSMALAITMATCSFITAFAGTVDVEISNNVGKADIITVRGLAPNTKVSIYAKNEAKAKAIATGKARTKGTETVAVLSVKELKGDTIYLTLTEVNKTESVKTKIVVPAEKVTNPLAKVEDETKVKVVNNAGNPDTVTVTGLDKNTIVSIYEEEDGKKPLATGKAGKDGKAVVSVKALKEDTIYLTLTEVNKKESEKSEKDVLPEVQTGPLMIDIRTNTITNSTTNSKINVEILNNVGKADTLTARGLAPNTIVSIYEEEDGAKPLAKGKAGKDGKAVVSVKALKEETIYLTVTEVNKTESEKVGVKVLKEIQTGPLIIDTTTNTITNIATNAKINVEVLNNTNKGDTVTVRGLAPNTMVSIYEDKDEEKSMAKGKAGKDGKAIVSVKELTAGLIYLTLTQVNELESNKIEVTVAAEQQTQELNAYSIIIVNNTLDNNIIVLGVSEGDIIKIYSTGDITQKPIVTGKVAKGQKLCIMKTKQLGKDGGKVFVTLTKNGKQESKVTEKLY